MLASLTFLLTAQAIARTPIEVRFEELFAASTLHGLSACVIKKDGTRALMAAGHADSEKTVPLTRAHRFLGGSTGKTFFAALAMQLEAEGTISLDAKLSDYLGGERWFLRLPNAATVTLTHLMRHQSGIPEHLDVPEFLPEVLKAPQRVWRPSELVAYCLDKAPLFASGEGWGYSDTNFILLAMAIEKATGKDAYTLITERYLRPLRLASTEPSTRGSYENLANGHHQSSLVFPAGWSLSEGKLLYLPQFEWAGGGFVTNPGDLAVWVRALVAGDVLDERARERMKQTVAARTGRGHEYGYGLMVRPSELGKSYGHGGFYPGYVTDVQHFPDVGVTVCIQANTDDFSAFNLNYQQYCVELAKAARE